MLLLLNIRYNVIMQEALSLEFYALSGCIDQIRVIFLRKGRRILDSIGFMC